MMAQRELFLLLDMHNKRYKGEEPSPGKTGKVIGLDRRTRTQLGPRKGLVSGRVQFKPGKNQELGWMVKWSLNHYQ